MPETPNQVTAATEIPPTPPTDRVGVQYPQMDPEWKKRWIAELLSGTRAQGIAGLRYTNDKFCCLGVLCDIHPDTNTHWKAPGPHETSDMYSIELSNPDPVTKEVVPQICTVAFLPTFLARKLNIDRMALTTLMRMNDDGVSFKEIAAWIDKNL